MNKSELVDTVASDAGVEKRQAESVLNAFFQTVTSETKGGGKVAWPGFGSFSTNKRAARQGRNPQTGAPVKIKASTVMRFSASSVLKESLNSRGGTRKTTAKKAAPAKKATATKSASTRSNGSSAAAKKAAPAKKAASATKAAAKKSAPAKKAPAKKAATAKKATPAKKATARKR